MPDQETINQQLVLLQAHRSTLAHELRRAAQFGGEALAPPEVASGIAAARGEIARIKAWLRANGTPADDEPGDVTSSRLTRRSAGIDYSAWGVRQFP